LIMCASCSCPQSFALAIASSCVLPLAKWTSMRRCFSSSHYHADDRAAGLGEGLVGGHLLPLPDVVVHAEYDLAVDGGVADVVREYRLHLVGRVVGVGLPDDDPDALVVVRLEEVLVVIHHLLEVGLEGHAPRSEARLVWGPGRLLPDAEELLPWAMDQNGPKLADCGVGLPFAPPELRHLLLEL